MGYPIITEVIYQSQKQNIRERIKNKKTTFVFLNQIY